MKRIVLLFGLLIAMAAGTFAQHPMCTGSRRDIYSFSPSERLELRNLIHDWLRTQINPSFPSGAQRYPLIWQHTEHNLMIHMTGQKIFLTWHRYYIQELEHWLTDNGHNKYVPLPSWDPTTAIPNEFFNNAAGSGSSQLDGGFPNISSQNITPPSISSYLPPAACGNFASADNFSASMEVSYHNAIHTAIGGSMASVTNAPGTAVFWIFHAWVDDLWYCYQKNCQLLGADLYVKKYNTDEGVTPVPSGIELWKAPDIWIRNNPDGFQNQVSEDIVMSGPGERAYVYVKVHNRGASPNRDNMGNIGVYWAQGSVGVQWPNPWTGATTIPCGQPRPLGGFIGNKPLRRVNENFLNNIHSGHHTTLEKDYYIYEFEWTGMPDPDHYTTCFPEVWQQQHFCLLARMDEEGSSTPTGSDIYANMSASNNIAMRNVTILKDGISTMRAGSILWGNYTELPMNNTRLTIRFESQEDAGLLQVADVSIKFDRETIREWNGNTRGLRRIDEQVFMLTADGGFIENFVLPPNTVKGLTIQVEPKPNQRITGTHKFDLVQYDGDRIVSGENYVVEPGEIQIQHTIPLAGQDKELYLIYPNPASSEITVLSTQNATSLLDISIFSALGQEVLTVKSLVQGTAISVSDLPEGVYIIRILDTESNTHSSHKLVISK